MNKRISILLIVVGLLASSCDNFLDVNTDPNNPSIVTPDLVLPVGLNYTATYVQEDRGLNHLGNMMMFTFGEANGFSWYDQEFRYAVNSTFYDDLFDDAYSSSLKQYHILENQPDEYSYYQAIGMIMKAYHFQILVDLYGSIPYEDALNRGGNATPEYADPETVYDDLLVKLDDAVQKIDSTASASSAEEVGDDDTIFGGDMEQWAQFANTLKIRILTRLSDAKDASFINDELSKIQNGRYIEDDVNINPGYIAEEEDKQNPYWTDLGEDASGNQTLSYQATPATQFVIDFFTGTNDPRLDAIFEEPDDGHKGVNQGQDNNTSALAPDMVSNLKLGGGILKSPTMGSTILTLAEHHLNLAELAQKNFNVTGSAQNHFESGIEASFNYLNATANPDSAAEAYYTSGTANTDWDASADKMDAIMTQKWLATMGITAEQAWFDYNRTSYPSAQPVGSASAPETAPTGFPISELASEDDRPVRLMYPQSEATRNSENLPDQPDVFEQKIFWAN